MIIAQVTQANMIATWQDLGRTRSAHHGIGQGGVMDIHAACWANRLLSRSINYPVIEITMGLFACQFHEFCQIAITGAEMDTTLNGNLIQTWQTYSVKPGDKLTFKPALSGVRAYLAINAELELESIFGSASTVTREQLPGLLGRSLSVGDKIEGEVISELKPFESKQVPRCYIPDYSDTLTLDLIAGYQFSKFSQRAIDTVLNSEYQVQANSSRMAYLFEGEAIKHSITSLESEGIAYGAVQVPPDGQPVILLNDRQTMGGYPKLGCISRLSGAALSQRFTPTNIRFRLMSVDAARGELKELLEFFVV